MKTVFISHSSSDAQVALEIATGIEEAFGKSVWVDLYDLNGGDDLASTIREAIQEASWFILLASEASMKSRWVQYEARLATFLSIEQHNYRILTVKLDDCKFPRDLDVELRRRSYIDGLNLAVKEVVVKIVESIRKDAQLLPAQAEVFVDRGAEMNALELALNRDRIVHVVGVRGIGKSALIRALARRLGRSLLKVELRSGHDLELISRQVLEVAGEPQPPKEIDKLELMQLAVSAAKRRIEVDSALFFNSAENAIDDEGNFYPFFRTFLSRCASPIFPSLF